MITNPANITGKNIKKCKGALIMSIFDINRDGKVDFTDYFLTYDILQTIDDCIADRKRQNCNSSWQDDCDLYCESDIDPDDFETEEEYQDALEEAMFDSYGF